MENPTKKAWRILYQPCGAFYWSALLEATGYNTEESVKKITALWNKRDTGKRTWKYEECFEDDIDHPKNRKKYANLGKMN